MVSDPSAGWAYAYDGNGTRVGKCTPSCASPSSSTTYIFSGSQDIAEYANGAGAGSPSTEFIYSDAIPGSGLLASVSGSTITYFQSDHLDWRVSTNSSGQITGSQAHFPFGESWYSSNGNEFAFTSYQRDSESGLDYAMARYYDSSAGRMCSADPVGGDPEDPQTWNRYLYARNDPIDLVDPSGKSFWNWLMDAALIAADVFSGGATTDVSIQTISMQNVGDLATFGAMLQLAQQNPQGQHQPPSEEQNHPSGQTSPAPGPFPKCGPDGYRDATATEELKVLKQAEQYKNTPYKSDGKTPNGFDCSGLVCYAVKHSVNPQMPDMGTAGMGHSPDLRPLKPGEPWHAGQPMLWPGHHVGLYDPNPPPDPKTGLPNDTLYSAEGPGKPNKATWGQPKWWPGLKPYRLRIPCGK
jgi:RHS repeat-associated protein